MVNDVCVTSLVHKYNSTFPVNNDLFIRTANVIIEIYHKQVLLFIVNKTFHKNRKILFLLVSKQYSFDIKTSLGHKVKHFILFV